MPLCAMLAVVGCLGATAAPVAAASPAKCASFIYARAVTIANASCSEATAALRNGRFSGPSNETFATTGWRCTQTGKRPDAHVRCTEGDATLSFTA